MKGTVAIKSGVLMACALVLGILPAVAEAQGRSGSRGRGGGGEADVKVGVTVIFGDTDRVTFRDYFLRHKIAAEPLPPGIAKNVARGKPLPPGIAKRALPSGLIALAPKVDRDVSFAIIGDAVVALKGGVVIDLMVGIFK